MIFHGTEKRQLTGLIEVLALNSTGTDTDKSHRTLLSEGVEGALRTNNWQLQCIVKLP
jgi:hypothetical protein